MSKKKPTLLILASSDLYKDPRVYRQVIALQDDFELTTVTNLSNKHKNFRKTIKHIIITDDYQTYTSDRLESRAPASSLKSFKEWIVALKLSENQLLREIFRTLRFIYRIFRTVRIRYILRNPTRFRNMYFGQPFIKRLKNILENNPVDIILVNEIDCLPSAVEFGKAKKIIYDAHEFSMGEAEESITWRLVNKPIIDRICNTYIPRVDHMLTVCDGILNEYKRLYPSVPIDLITNAAPYVNITTRKTKIPVRMIHHGLADRSRNIEGMIHTMAALKDKLRYTLDLMLVYNDHEYVKELKASAAAVNEKSGFEQVRFLPPVKLSKIIRTISTYDIQIIMTPPLNFNNRHSLPNKFFEAIQARNAIAIGPITEMAKIVRKYELGIVSDTFLPTEMAARLDALTLKGIDRFKGNSSKVAKKFNAEKNGRELVRIIERVLR